MSRAEMIASYHLFVAGVSHRNDGLVFVRCGGVSAECPMFIVSPPLWMSMSRYRRHLVTSQAWETFPRPSWPETKRNNCQCLLNTTILTTTVTTLTQTVNNHNHDRINYDYCNNPFLIVHCHEYYHLSFIV